MAFATAIVPEIVSISFSTSPLLNLRLSGLIFASVSLPRRVPSGGLVYTSLNFSPSALASATNRLPRRSYHPVCQNVRWPSLLVKLQPACRLWFGLHIGRCPYNFLGLRFFRALMWVSTSASASSLPSLLASVSDCASHIQSTPDNSSLRG